MFKKFFICIISLIVFAFPPQVSASSQKTACYVSYWPNPSPIPHPATFHRAIDVNPDGAFVQLDDGVVWGIHSNDAYKTLDWLAEDLIHVTPNQDWFSTYPYRLINENTGASVRAYLYYPISGFFYVQNIDYYDGVILLNDGSSWWVGEKYMYSLDKWRIGDFVTLGSNQEHEPYFPWNYEEEPNILINLRTQHYVASQWLYSDTK